MLVAIPRSGHFSGRRLKAHGIVNRGGWFGERWLAVITISNALHAAIIIEAGNETDAIDYLADSPTWSHLIDCEECWDCGSVDHYCDCDHQTYAGNDSHRVNLDYLTILERCEVDFFAQEVQ